MKPHTPRMWLMPFLPLGLISTVGREALKGESGAGLVLSINLAAHTICRCHSLPSFSSTEEEEVTFSCQIPVTQQHGLFHTPTFSTPVKTAQQYLRLEVLSDEKTSFLTQWWRISENAAQFLSPLLFSWVDLKSWWSAWSCDELQDVMG